MGKHGQNLKHLFIQHQMHAEVSFSQYNTQYLEPALHSVYFLLRLYGRKQKNGVYQSRSSMFHSPRRKSMHFTAITFLYTYDLVVPRKMRNSCMGTLLKII